MTKFTRDFLLGGLNPREISAKYSTCDRVSDNEEKIVVRVADTNLFDSRYGYGLILGRTKFIWLKRWQVLAPNWFTPKGKRDVVLTKEYFKVQDSTSEFKGINVGDCESDSEFEKANGYHGWEDLVDFAKRQEADEVADIDEPLRIR